jgi:spore cortex formation protein SpoVR/YcgB (stage V sporulation)
MNNFITTSSAWTFEDLKRANEEIGRIAREKYGLDTFPNQIEIITAEQMIDNYSSIGLPVHYYHWSLGKEAENTRRAYLHGDTNLAYELIINSNPAISYLMEENSSAMQFLVIAHACYGHNSFFKGNYLFRQWTSPDAIVDYMLFAKHYIVECEEKYGEEDVEYFLDSCHALKNYGVDRYKHPDPISLEKEKLRQNEREAYLQTQVNELWNKTVPGRKKSPDTRKEAPLFPSEPQENILYFIEKNAPFLEPWQREIVRIVRKIAQYFYPQRQTKVMNEGWATFWHYTLMNDLYDEGFLSDGFMIEWLKSHTNVIFQPTYNETRIIGGKEVEIYSGINPYALGFALWGDVRRICENPTKEDERWFPDIAGTDWLSSMKFAMQNFKDESFILQYLSPKVMRDMRLWSLTDDPSVDKDYWTVEAIHNQEGYRELRRMLAKQYDISVNEPDIQVWRADVRRDRTLTLRHTEHDGIPLHERTATEVLKHLYQLWQCPVRIEALKSDGKVELIADCPSSKTSKKK